MPRYLTLASLRQPERLREPGLLVGWSLEAESRRPAIGFNYGNPLESPETGYQDPVLLDGEGHLITIAPTGAGKGTGCIIPALLRYLGPVVVIDPKGENVAVTARRRRELGQQVIVIDPMGLTGTDSDTFNPLDAIDISQARAVDEVVSLVQALTSASQVDNDSDSRYWVQRAQHLTVGIVLEVLQVAQERREQGDVLARASLVQVRDMVGSAVANPIELAETLLKSRHPEVQRIATALQLRAAETLGGILSFAQEYVDFLRGDAVQASVATTSFDIEAITRGDPLSIYLVLPPHMLESHGRLLRLWLSAVMSCITRRRAKPAQSTLLVIDEAAQLGELPQLRQAITLLRGYGLQTWSFWQDVSQLQQLYPASWKTMVNNCSVLQCFGALNKVAAQDMSSLTGYGDADEVLDLELDEMILQTGGQPAVVAQLPNYLSNPAFNGLYDPNPYHVNGRDVMPPRGPTQRLYQRPPQADSPTDNGPNKKVIKPLHYAMFTVEDELLDGLLRRWQ